VIKQEDDLLHLKWDRGKEVQLRTVQGYNRYSSRESSFFLSFFFLSPTSFYLTRLDVESYYSFYHTQGHTTVGRTPLDKGSARRRDLYLTTHNTYNRQTSMPSSGFEPAIPACERLQTHVLHRSAILVRVIWKKQTVRVKCRVFLIKTLDTGNYDCVLQGKLFKNWTVAFKKFVRRSRL
jgi:hypothetical protein